MSYERILKDTRDAIFEKRTQIKTQQEHLKVWRNIAEMVGKDIVDQEEIEKYNDIIKSIIDLEEKITSFESDVEELERDADKLEKIIIESRQN